jgi:signal transduction histidine kinase
MKNAVMSAAADSRAATNTSSLDNITSSFLHDLRNPLAAICGGAEILLSGNLAPADTRRVASNMHRSAGRMRDMIAEFAGAGRPRVDAIERCDLRTILVDCCEAAGIAERDGIEIALDVPNQFQIPVSPIRIKSVFVNLIVNAAEAMPAGGFVRITAMELHDRVRIEVEDNGPGVPAEIRGRLFEPFVTANKKGGLGLGLTLSRQTVRELGGDLWAEPAAGSRFVISLPL